MDEGGCLENSCGETHRGFESLSLRLGRTSGRCRSGRSGAPAKRLSGSYILDRGFESLPPRLSHAEAQTRLPEPGRLDRPNALVAQWIEHLLAEQGVACSSRAEGAEAAHPIATWMSGLISKRVVNAVGRKAHGRRAEWAG